MLDFALDEDFLFPYRVREPFWGFVDGGGNSIGELAFIRSYSHVKPNGEKERWWEVCQRVIEGMYHEQKRWCQEHVILWDEEQAQESAQEAYDLLFRRCWAPPGRGLQMIGTRLIHEVHDSTAAQNCAFRSTEQFAKGRPGEPYAWTMEASMLGVGVGFDTSATQLGLTVQLPGTSPDETMLSQDVETYIVEDTRESWASSVEALINSYLIPGRPTLEFDYSQVRPAGSIISTFGGYASGPGALRWCHEQIRKQFEKNVGQAYSSRLIVDVMNIIGKAVVMGNTRRTAEIAIGDADDKDFLHLKDWTLDENKERLDGKNGWGYLSNNSIFASVGMDYSHVVDLISRGGEPGLVWMDVTNKYARLVDPPKKDNAHGYNPCVTGDTLLLTQEYGLKRIDELAKSQELFHVWNGKNQWAASHAWSTGIKPVIEVKLLNGQTIRTTDDHRVKNSDGHEVYVRDIKVGDKFSPSLGDGTWTGTFELTEDDATMLGLVQGDGMVRWDLVYISTNEQEVIDFVEDYCNARSDVRLRMFDKDNMTVLEMKGLVPLLKQAGFELEQCKNRGTGRIEQRSVKLPWRALPTQIMHGTPDTVRWFLGGLFSANGCVLRNKANVNLKTSCRQLAGQVQQLLLALGIHAYIMGDSPANEQGTSVEWEGKGTIYSRPSWTVATNKADLFHDQITFLHEHKNNHEYVMGARAHLVRPSKVRSVTLFEPEEVYDFSEPETHWAFGNGFIIHNCGEQPLNGAGELCTLVNVYPTNCMTHEEYLRAVKYAYLYGKTITLVPTRWPQSNAVMQRHRRIGTSFNGAWQFVEQHGYIELDRWMDTGYKAIQQWDKIYSDWLCVRKSIRMTTVKPDGTGSLLAGCTPGAHPNPGSEYYLRRIRYQKDDPIVPLLVAAGYDVEPAQAEPHRTVVCAFPLASPTGVRSQDEASVYEKIHLGVRMQRMWSDNSVSLTLTYLPEEKKELGNLLRMFEGQLKSLSFLEIAPGQYDQMPYEKITREQYEEYSSRLNPLQLDALYGSGVEVEVEAGCTTDACEVKLW